MHSIISLIFEEFSIIQAAFNEILDVIIIITADELNYHIGRDEGFSLILATIDDQRDPHFRDMALHRDPPILKLLLCMCWIKLHNILGVLIFFLPDNLHQF